MKTPRAILLALLLTSCVHAPDQEAYVTSMGFTEPQRAKPCMHDSFVTIDGVRVPVTFVDSE